MRVEREGNYWIVVSGKGYKERFFCCYVDADKSSWTLKQPWGAQRFRTEAQANECLSELKRRAKLRRDGRMLAREKEMR